MLALGFIFGADGNDYVSKSVKMAEWLVDFNETYTVEKTKKKTTRTRRSSKKGAAATSEPVVAEAPAAEVEAPAAE